ncbi:MAG: acetyl-CoA carboxylase carboxyltransferase subunit alpha [Alphaproteobacteria bacterium]|nr:acetyl-CoA carboxylase carboxyltransferase subunit alpha [Alphaproteobacteria bacterium]
MQYLDFENKILEIDARMEEVKISKTSDPEGLAKELDRLKEKKQKALADLYKDLTPWQKCAVARHENRPHTIDYIKTIFKDFSPLCGDRSFAEDKAIIGGFAKLGNDTVMVIGHEKGHDTDSRLEHNFGMAKPEGYRKVIRLMRLAEQFGVPVITLVDTAGAYPGVEGEERGQGQAIASCTETCLDIKVPLIATIIGEGGSGGAIAMAAGNVIMMLDNSIYSVISPEGCASILWKDHKYAPTAAEILNLTASDLKRLGVIDTVIEEPIGGAHRFPKEAMMAVKGAIQNALESLKGKTGEELRRIRQDKFLQMTRLEQSDD